ncbi:ATP synthase F1 subunit gamma [Mahella sp.]|jgi:F-type H+-transporting ATPase subunit gamma|uniref:ATP synthase F1 subunit gamma n=1 Tax=Mahella sp. TaxID=2798721 RepID=UPI0025C07B4F|nr:ATP synthase F1 subunit gamma [Mahella sp.]MBZ4665061.1 synthase gamma subunit [Mahella sp.]MDK2902096.1 F-type H+-transporting ATPase subunit gamma [Clostridiales bacterium]MDK2991137.1 F-type H+-transporting ATPase subunit gamma [Clostridiales bacterium]
MPSRSELLERIKSVRETQQITKAMYLISTTKVRRARAQLNATLPYYHKIRETMADILQHSPDVTSHFISRDIGDRPKRIGYIVITGDRGLCGAYNHNIIKEAVAQMDDKPERSLFVVGEVGRRYFISHGYTIDVEFLYTAQDPSIYNARDIADMMVRLYNQQLLDEIYVIYTELVSGSRQEPRTLRLLPLETERLKLDEDNDGIREFIKYEPSRHAVFRVLVPEYIKGLIYGALVESFTSEHSARMLAMQTATDNADELLKDLTLTYNTVRQEAITQEMAEIIGGANAIAKE